MASAERFQTGVIYPFPLNQEVVDEALDRYAAAKQAGSLIPTDAYDIVYVAAEHGNDTARDVMGREQFEGDGK